MLASYLVFFLIYLNEAENARIEIYAAGRSRSKAAQRFGKYIDKHYFHFIEDDLSGEHIIGRSYDYVFHMASKASSQFYAVDPLGVVNPNVFSTYTILSDLRDFPCQSMVFVSSGEVYGAVEADSIGEHDFGPSDPLDIRYCYGESKRMGECFCKCFQQQYRIPVKIVRLGHTYGPTMDIVNDKRVFAEFVGNVVRRENIIIKSSGTPMRAFCYAEDALFAFMTVLLRGTDGEAYNIANEKGLISIRDLAETLVSLFPKYNLSVEYIARDANDTYIESRQMIHPVPSTKKIEQLGWKCEIDVREGFRRTIESFNEQKDWKGDGEPVL